MTLPTEGEEYAKLLEHLRLGQESAAMLANLAGMHDRKLTQQGWLAVEEQMKRMQHAITKLDHLAWNCDGDIDGVCFELVGEVCHADCEIRGNIHGNVPGPQNP